MLLLILLLAPSVFSFESSFNYGCQTGKCTFQLVVPIEVAQYIEEGALSNEMSKISSSLSSLNETIQALQSNGTDDFTTKFDTNYNPVNASAKDLSSNVIVTVGNADKLASDSQNANNTAQLLYNSIDCFRGGKSSSYTCFTRPTTVAPPTTTVGLSSTVNPATDATQGSEGTSVPVTDASSDASTSSNDASAATSPSTAEASSPVVETTTTEH